jgi:gliding motility-associated protein GldC
MNTSEIKFNIELNDQKYIDRILWESTDKPSDGPDSTDALAISIWDPIQKNTLRIDLWSKNMTAFEMKRFTVDSIGGLAESLRNATGDNKMADLMQDFCQQLVKHVEKSEK